MAQVKVNRLVPDMLPCNCGGGTWLKKEETTLYHNGLIRPTVIMKYSIYCDACNTEVTSDRPDLAVSVWNNVIKERLDKQSRTGRLIEH